MPRFRLVPLVPRTHRKAMRLQPPLAFSWTPSPRILAASVGCAAFLTSCGGSADSSAAAPDLDAPEVAAALAAVTPAAIERHMRVLADDSMAGRAPGSRGFEAAASYAEGVLRDLGLQPAGENGGYRQAVPLRHSTVVEPESGMSVQTPAGTHDLTYDVDFYLGADPLRPSVALDDAPVIFVGYGVSASGLGYDDYADADVAGKVVLFLSGAPSSFPSDERAYYSSGATKTSEALGRGAVGTMTFWAPGDPRLRWDVNAARAKRGSFDWLDADGTPSRADEALMGSASLNHSAVDALFTGSPTPLEQAMERASSDRPQAFDLASRVSMRTVTEHADVNSFNVVAELEGSDPTLRDEYVTYVGHVDHFGVGVAVNGDSIYNGAHDNASGVSIVLETARAFTSLPTAPRRSVLFLIVTAEEWGLLGSDYFVEHPTVPRESLVANFSLDMPFLFHPLLDIVPYGADHTSMGDAVATAATHMGLGLGPDPIPEQVLFIRSDHFSFIRHGIPALFIKSGFETGDERDGGAINTGYRQERYHTPFDDMSQDFDFESGADHARINFLTGYVIAQEDQRPTWNRGDFFAGLFAGR